MADDFYPFVDSGDPAPDNSHITGISDPVESGNAPDAQGETSVGAAGEQPEPPSGAGETTVYATRIAIYDDMLSTPRVLVVQPKDPRSYLEEVTNTVYRCMKEQGGSLSLMVIRELVENFIHAHFAEPIVSVLDGGNTIRFADQGPGISDKERAFEFGVTSANRSMKRYIRGTGAGLPMVQQYLENAGGAVSIEDNLGAGTVVTVSVDPARVAEIEANSGRGAAVRGTQFTSARIGGRGAAFPTSGGFGQMATGAEYQTPPYSAGEAAAPMGFGGDAQAAYAQQFPYAQQPMGRPQGAVGAPPTAGTGYPGQVGGPQPPYGYPIGYPGYVPGYQPVQSFQQYGQKFSTIPQTPYQARETMQPDLAPKQTGWGGGTGPFLTERGLQALDFLAAHGQCGPTELTNAFGHSGPTWSRELATLSGCGFAMKHGRKYFLTELGASWVAEHRTSE